MRSALSLPYLPPLPSLATQMERAARYAESMRERKESDRVRAMTRDQKEAYKRRLELYNMLTGRRKTVVQLADESGHSARLVAKDLESLVKEFPDIKRLRLGSANTSPFVWWREEE